MTNVLFAVVMLHSATVGDAWSKANLFQVSAEGIAPVISTYKTKRACEVAAGEIVSALGDMVDSGAMDRKDINKNRFVCTIRE